MESSIEETRAPSDLKACMNFKWTDELTLQFILYRHERRMLFTKKRNTSRYGWQQILRDMGLAVYVTPYQAQKKWNNLWSKYKLAKRGQMEGTTHEDPNSSWPFFTVLDAIASGKTVTITSPVGTSPTFQQGAASCSSSINTTINASVLQSPEEPPVKKVKSDDHTRVRQWDIEPEDSKTQIIELLQTNLHQLDEIKAAIETQGQNIVSMLSQLIHVVSSNGKSNASSGGGGGGGGSEPSRIDEAITATIREIGISQESI